MMIAALPMSAIFRWSDISFALTFMIRPACRAEASALPTKVWPDHIYVHCRIS
jgi:hypothetical protein